MITREICKLCWRTNRTGFRVPDEIWRAVVPAFFWPSVVCLDCFTRLADEKLVRWDEDIEFFPVSLARHLQEIVPAGEKDRVDDFE